MTVTVEKMADWYFHNGSPIQAACCHLVVNDHKVLCDIHFTLSCLQRMGITFVTCHYNTIQYNKNILYSALSLSLRSMSRSHSCLHECTPCRSIPSASPCRRQAKIERAQIVLENMRHVYHVSGGI